MHCRGPSLGHDLCTFQLTNVPCGPAALVFEGVGWFDVAVAVFARRHDFLAARFVHFSERFAAMSPEEVKAMLLERLRPIPRTAETRATNKS